MAPIPIPSAGVPLSEFPTDGGSKKSRAPQAVKVASTGNDSMEQILAKMRNGSTDISVSLGKKPVLIVDNKVFPIQTLYQPQALLFRKPKDSSKLQLSARFTLKDALARSKMNTSVDIDLNDPAILALQQSFAEAKEKKDTNQAIFVKDSSKLPPAKGGRSALLKSHRIGLFGKSGTGTSNSTTRSLPTSPSLGGITPQSGQRDAKTVKQEAIKRALIHLLAVRAVSEKYVVSELKCSAADLKPLLEKYGRESNFDKTKFNLSERGYKELDVWNFPYKNEDDRKGAIERAIAAFDRQRISVSDPLWQKLLPKDERGKGKVLSKLGNLSHGPISQAKTPRINVESAAAGGDASDKEKYSEEERTGRLVPHDTQVRSRSQDPLDKKKVSEREAQSKRLFAKDPKKAADMAKAKAKAIADGVEKKRKQAAKKEEKAAAAAAAAAKKNTSKSTSAQSSKIKSAEFILDSDEDIDMEDVQSEGSSNLKRKAEEESPVNGAPNKKRKHELDPPKASSKSSQEKKPTEPKPVEKKPTPTKPTEKKQLERKVQAAEKPSSERKHTKEAMEKKDTMSARPVAKTEKEKPVKKPQPPTADTKKPPQKEKPAPLSTSTKPRIPESQRSAAMSRSLSHKRSGSSPVKPSPLGSSPPTNASDLENEQVYKTISSKSSSSSGSPLINQRRERLEAQKQAARASNKSNAGPTNGSSDRPLKRRASELDPHINQQGGIASANPQIAKPTTNGAGPPAAKRPRPSFPESPPATSPEADKPPTTTSSDDLSPVPVEIEAEEPTPSQRDLEYARSFKTQWARYNAALRELSALVDPPTERVEKLRRMHRKLLAHKEQLWAMAGGR